MHAQLGIMGLIKCCFLYWATYIYSEIENRFQSGLFTLYEGKQGVALPAFTSLCCSFFARVHLSMFASNFFIASYVPSGDKVEETEVHARAVKSM